jgi:hypothetical protein
MLLGACIIPDFNEILKSGNSFRLEIDVKVIRRSGKAPAWSAGKYPIVKGLYVIIWKTNHICLMI